MYVPLIQLATGNRHNNETVILRKNVTKFKNMRKWMVEFLRNFKSPGIKIARVNCFRITIPTNLLTFLRRWGPL